jgi:hypothetical protein
VAAFLLCSTAPSETRGSHHSHAACVLVTVVIARGACAPAALSRINAWRPVRGAASGLTSVPATRLAASQARGWRPASRASLDLRASSLWVVRSSWAVLPALDTASKHDFLLVERLPHGLFPSALELAVLTSHLAQAPPKYVSCICRWCHAGCHVGRPFPGSARNNPGSRPGEIASLHSLLYPGARPS